jgi:hypothetical protein
MPEILTESFCERCGTRYTFESAAPTKARKLGRFKTLSKGLKNYVPATTRRWTRRWPPPAATKSGR